jgi:hypothetical protein
MCQDLLALSSSETSGPSLRASNAPVPVSANCQPAKMACIVLTSFAMAALLSASRLAQADSSPSSRSRCSTCLLNTAISL